MYKVLQLILNELCNRLLYKHEVGGYVLNMHVDISTYSELDL